MYVCMYVQTTLHCDLLSPEIQSYLRTENEGGQKYSAPHAQLGLFDANDYKNK